MKTTSHSSAFSLVEVALALGVAAFCLLAIFGLLPTGMNSNQASVQQTVAAGIASEVVADLRSTPVTASTSGTTSPRFGFSIPAYNGVSTMPPNKPNANNTKFFAAGGGVVGANLTSGTTAMYRATVGFLPPAPSSTGTNRTATMARILVTWPAVADQGSAVKAADWPVNYTGSFETITALDRN